MLNTLKRNSQFLAASAIALIIAGCPATAPNTGDQTGTGKASMTGSVTKDGQAPGKMLQWF